MIYFFSILGRVTWRFITLCGGGERVPGNLGPAEGRPPLAALVRAMAEGRVGHEIYFAGPPVRTTGKRL